jgi:hypothetical protein
MLEMFASSGLFLHQQCSEKIKKKKLEKKKASKDGTTNSYGETVPKQHMLSG